MAMQYELLKEVAAGRKAGDGIESTTAIYRSHLVTEETETTCLGSRTVYELFTNAVKEFKSCKLHGKRERLPNGTVEDYKWETYRDVELTTESIHKALRLIGCAEGAKIGIYGANAPEWTQSMLACTYFSAICVPLYDSLAANAIEYIIQHAGIEFVFVSEHNCSHLSAAIKAMGHDAAQIRGVCIWSDLTDTPEDKIKESIIVLKDSGIEVLMWQELLHKGASVSASAKCADLDATPEKDPEKPVIIMYTSGTTGVPKGVVISDRAVISTVASTLRYGEIYLGKTEEEVHLSYLTTAHVYGYITELLAIAAGARVGYWQGRIDKLLSDIQALRPTSLSGVPRVWERIYDTTMKKVNERGIIAKSVFDLGFYCKRSLTKNGFGKNVMVSLLDSVLFSKIRSSLGGRLTFVSSGAAPLPPHIEEFLRTALTVPILQGYGLTESCAATCLTLPYRPDMFGTVGACMPCVEFRLESVKDMGYEIESTTPSGEVCFRGPCMFSAYYRNEEEYAKVVDEDGFFHTGDIAQLTSTGALKIVDRKKNIFKLNQGEYVAVEKIESILRAAESVEQIWVYGDSHRRSLVAIVFPNVHCIQQLMNSDITIEDICQSENVKKEVLSQLTSIGKGGGLKGFEMVRNAALVMDGFTVENGMMTPSFKLKRHDLLRKFSSVINDLYNEIEG